MPRRLRDGKYLPMIDPASLTMTRRERIEELRLYFVNVLCEDPQDGSPFDCAVLDTLDRIEREYPEGETLEPWEILAHLGEKARVNRRATDEAEGTPPPDGIRRTVFIEPTHQEDSPPLQMGCPDCDHPLVYEEGCMKCHNCGYCECG